MRVVVTGLGIVSPVGCTVPEFWTSVCEGRHGMRELTRFPTKDYAFSRGGEITDFVFPSSLGAPPSGSDLASQFMLAATAQAVQDANLADITDTAVVLSTNFGSVSSGEDFMAWAIGARPDPAGTFSGLSFQPCADRVADRWQFHGPRINLSLSCSSGTAALVAALELIRSGRARAVIAGGYDALSRFAWSGLSVLRTMSKDAVRPFDRNRDGTLFSEGAGAVIMEDADHAFERGAHVYCELIGGAMNNNAHHMTAPAKEGAGSAAVMRAAILDAGIRPVEISHINAHGTGTKPNDSTETQAIKAVLGDHARKVPVTSIKSTTGHLMGAAGSAEAIASILTLRDQVIPPTTNFKDSDPECDLDYVFNTRRAAPVNTVLSNSAGICGCNAAVIFRRLSNGN